MDLISCGLMIAIIATMVWMQWFLRGPFFRRDIGDIAVAPDGAISPVDGTIVYVRHSAEGPIYGEKLGEQHYAGEFPYPFTHVGIYMTPLDRHYIVAPTSGTVVAIEHWKAGANLPMLDMLEYVKVMFLRNFIKWFERHLFGWLTQNERVVLTVQSFSGYRYRMLLIGDKYVNKTSLFVEVGQHIRQGQKLAFISRGSQCDLVFPTSQFHEMPAIKVGVKTTVGQTILGSVGF